MVALSGSEAMMLDHPSHELQRNHL